MSAHLGLVSPVLQGSPLVKGPKPAQNALLQLILAAMVAYRCPPQSIIPGHALLSAFAYRIGDSGESAHPLKLLRPDGGSCPHVPLGSHHSDSGAGEKVAQDRFGRSSLLGRLASEGSPG